MDNTPGQCSLYKIGISKQEGSKVQRIKLQLILTVGWTGALQSSVALRSSVEQGETNWELLVGTAVEKKKL